MSTRTQIRPTLVIPNALASPANTSAMTQTIISAPTQLQSCSEVTYHVYWTGGSVAGTFSVQTCSDFVVTANGGITGGTWNTIPLNILNLNGVSGSLSLGVAISDSSGEGDICVSTIGMAAIRLVFTYASGGSSAVLSAYISGGVK